MNDTLTDSYQFTAADRCDRCGAQAKAKVDTLHGDLLFCGHHFNQHKDALAPIAVTIHQS